MSATTMCVTKAITQALQSRFKKPAWISSFSMSKDVVLLLLKLTENEKLSRCYELCKSFTNTFLFAGSKRAVSNCQDDSGSQSLNRICFISAEMERAS